MDMSKFNTSSTELDKFKDDTSSVQEADLDKLDQIKSNATQIDTMYTVNTNTVVVDGDSIAAANGYKIVTGTTAIYGEAKGFFTWANILLNNFFDLSQETKK